MMSLIVRPIVYVRNLIAAGIAFLIRPIMHEMLYKLNRLNQFNLSTAALHQRTFLPFKGAHKGRDIVVMACGPSVGEYKPISNAIHIGVNRAYRQDKIPLDYLFAFDFNQMNANRDSCREFDSYRKESCLKFYGLTNDGSSDINWLPSESDAMECNAFRFRADGIVWAGPCESSFNYDISTMPLADFGSIVFSAIQFALWTNPKRIFLVGCDCSRSGHFDSRDKNFLPLERMFSAYGKLKAFARTYYPDTEIISVNPVGLKGLFRDWYQKDGELV